MCEPKARVECCQQTCGAPDEASDPAVWGQGRAECWDGCDLSLQGSSERWSWESCSGRSFHLEDKVKVINLKCNENKINIYI